MKKKCMAFNIFDSLAFSFHPAILQLFAPEAKLPTEIEDLLFVLVYAIPSAMQMETIDAKWQKNTSQN